jgi:hypothetical protein
MKTTLILVAMLTALLLSGCNPFEDKEKALEIIRLQLELSSQQGTRAAEIEYGERQVSMYLGCKQFFNRCSPETAERGEKLLQLGYTGTTAGWYWVGLLGELTCKAIAAAVFFLTLRFLHLVAIAPKKEAVDSAQGLIDSAEERARTINIRTNELEMRNGLMKRELARIFHAPRTHSQNHMVFDTVQHQA